MRVFPWLQGRDDDRKEPRRPKLRVVKLPRAGVDGLGKAPFHLYAAAAKGAGSFFGNHGVPLLVFDPDGFIEQAVHPRAGNVKEEALAAFNAEPDVQSRRLERDQEYDLSREPRLPALERARWPAIAAVSHQKDFSRSSRFFPQRSRPDGTTLYCFAAHANGSFRHIAPLPSGNN